MIDIVVIDCNATPAQGRSDPCCLSTFSLLEKHPPLLER